MRRNLAKCKHIVILKLWHKFVSFDRWNFLTPSITKIDEWKVIMLFESHALYCYFQKYFTTITFQNFYPSVFQEIVTLKQGRIQQIFWGMHLLIIYQGLHLYHLSIKFFSEYQSVGTLYTLRFSSWHYIWILNISPLVPYHQILLA